MRGGGQQGRRTSKEKEQVRLAADLLSCAGNEIMADIRIVAKDGGVIPASRFVLGARSPVLQKMLYKSGGAEEGAVGRSRELRLNYSRGVARALVNYCRSNEIEPSSHHSKQEHYHRNSNAEAYGRELVEMCDCARTFELDGLEDLVCQTATSLMEEFPDQACVIFDEASAFVDEACTNDEAVAPLKYIALAIIRKDPESALIKRNGFHRRQPGVSYLRADALEEILCDRRMCTEEVTLFRALNMWVDSNPIGGAANLRERKRLARRYVENYIDLSSIAPSDLFGVVSESGLVGIDTISEALCQMALRAEKEGVIFSKRRAGTLQEPAVVKPVAIKKQQVSHVNDTSSRSFFNYTLEDDSSLVSETSYAAPQRDPPDTGRSSSRRRSRQKEERKLSRASQQQTKKKTELVDIIDYFVGDGCCKHPQVSREETTL